MRRLNAAGARGSEKGFCALGPQSEENCHPGAHSDPGPAALTSKRLGKIEHGGLEASTFSFFVRTGFYKPHCERQQVPTSSKVPAHPDAVQERPGRR